MQLLESERGAAFELTWPARAPAPFPPPSSTRPQSLSGVNVLVLEDDDGVASLLETALGARGAAVERVTTEAETLALLDTRPFDVVLLDLSPFDSDVRGGLERVAGAANQAHLVVMTGAMGDVPDSLACGELACIPKPFEIPELVRTIAGLVGVSELHETPLSGARAADPPADINPDGGGDKPG